MDGQTDDRRFEANRLGLGVAVGLTAAFIAAGTWMLGSGSDPTQPDPAPVVAEVETTERARPPLAVAPPPSDADQRAGRKSERTR